MSDKKLLEEVCILRVILVIFLITYHSMLPFCHNQFWPPIVNDGDDIQQIYILIAKLSYAFMLECFVFISGYVYGYQIRSGKHTISWKETVLRKAKRLLIPCLIFSVVFIFLFTYGPDYSIKDFVIDLSKGAGHLWFLPMLFWCFFGLFIIENLNFLKNSKFIFALLFLISAVSIYSFPFRISNAMYYMIFFYLGYIVTRNQIDFSKYTNRKSILIIFCLYILTFALRFNLDLTSEFSDHFFALIKRTVQLMNSLLGTVWIFLFISYLLKYKYVRITERFIKLSSASFGVYILQEFIIRGIYYKSSAPEYLRWTTPMLTIIVTLLISVLVTRLACRNKVGRFLLS